MNLAMLDNWQTFYDLMEDANRANVSFYPVNALGLVALDNRSTKDGPPRRRGAGARSTGHPAHYFSASRRFMPSDLVASPLREPSFAGREYGRPCRGRHATLDSGIRRVVDEASTIATTYGLLLDQHEARWQVPQAHGSREASDVDVRARHGYRAATREEIEEGQMAAATAEAAAPPATGSGRAERARERTPGRAAQDLGELCSHRSGRRDRTPRALLGAHQSLDPQSCGPASGWAADRSIVAVLSAENEVLTESTTPLPAGQRALASRILARWWSLNTTSWCGLVLRRRSTACRTVTRFG